MPRFLGFVELSILRHVAYAYGVLPSVCSLCEGRSGNIPRSFCICLMLAIQCHMPLVICLWIMAYCFVVAHSVDRDTTSLWLWHFGLVYFFIVSTSMEGLYMIQ